MTDGADGPQFLLSPTGRGFKISFGESELGLEEWHRVRTAVYARLRKNGFPPPVLLDLAEHYEYQTLVRLFLQKTKDGSLRIGAHRSRKKTKSKQSLQQLFADRKGKNSKTKHSITASAALALCLRLMLRKIKYDSKKGKTPARRAGVPRSIIARVAMDLLNGCALRDCPPHRCLIDLFHELLDIDIESKRWLSPHWEVQEFVARTIAHYPTISTRELARLLRIQPSTISRWRNNSDFKAMVEQVTQEKTQGDNHMASDTDPPELNDPNHPVVKKTLALMSALYLK